MYWNKLFSDLIFTDAPECTITTVDKDGTPALVCTALGNPQEMTFNWTVKEGNETFNETNNIIKDKVKSYLLLDSSIETYRTYSCVAHNEIGNSGACKREVAGNVFHLIYIILRFYYWNTYN